MACRLPGGIDSPDQLWDALLRGDDLITEIPTERWDAETFYDPERGVPGRSVTKWGGFLDDVAGFDSEFFGIGDREATAIDPQHRLLLETAWEAVQHAGVNPTTLAGSATGVFVGLAHDDYTLVTGTTGALEEPYGYTGTAFSMASGRISYTLGLSGPAVTVDTACSSGLVTVHMACRSLHEGESDLALAGGCMLMLEPRVSSSMSAIGMLSDTGRCQSFDVNANGFVRSEGSAMVLLKRLPDAVRDGDRILAVIRGTATNQDGRSDTITMPSMDAQVAAYRSALDAADVDPAGIGMVEAHGTGTPVGDPIEYRGLAQVYGIDHPCALTSVKSNVGHTESAAGTVGLIKAVMALRHGTVPRMLHFTRLPEELARVDTNLFVPDAVDAVARRQRPAAPGGGVVVRDVGHQRARHPRTGSRTRRTQRCRSRFGDDEAAAVSGVVHVGRSAAPNRRTAGRLGRAQRARRRAAGCRLYPGASPRAWAGTHDGAGKRPTGAGRGIA